MIQTSAMRPDRVQRNQLTVHAPMHDGEAYWTSD